MSSPSRCWSDRRKWGPCHRRSDSQTDRWGRPLSPSVWLSAFFIYRPLHSLAPVSDGCRIKCWGQKEKGRGGLNLLWLYVEIKWDLPSTTFNIKEENFPTLFYPLATNRKGQTVKWHEFHLYFTHYKARPESWPFKRLLQNYFVWPGSAQRFLGNWTLDSGEF